MSQSSYSGASSTCRLFDLNPKIDCFTTDDCQRFLDTSNHNSFDEDYGCCDCEWWSEANDFGADSALPLSCKCLAKSATSSGRPTSVHKQHFPILKKPTAALDDRDALCQRLAALQLQPSSSSPTHQHFEELPVSDKRILQRMLAKRQELWQRNELAHGAHERWQHDQLARRRQQQQHAADVAHKSQLSLIADRRRFDERRAALWQRDRMRTRDIRSEQLHRQHRTAERLAEARTEHERQAAARQAGEAQRLAEASSRRAHIDTDRKRRQLDCVGQLADRLYVARVVRDDRTEAYRQRVAAANEAQAAQHAKRLQAVRSGQRDSVARVHRDMEDRAARGAAFVRQRADGMMAQRRRAMLTAELRELVREAMPLGDGGADGGSKSGSGWVTWRSGAERVLSRAGI